MKHTACVLCVTRVVPYYSSVEINDFNQSFNVKIGDFTIDPSNPLFKNAFSNRKLQFSTKLRSVLSIN